MKTNNIVPHTVILAALLVSALTLPTPAEASWGTAYPILPDLPGADIRGQARVIIHMDQDEPLVEVDGQLYSLDGRPLEVGFDGLATITLLFVVPRDAGLFVSENGLWTKQLEPSDTSTMLAFDLLDGAYRAIAPANGEPEELGFEVVLPGQPAPTVPDVVIRPTEDDPDPS